ncbi:hypothetical protein ACET3Z_004612 [Daucus carota]
MDENIDEMNCGYRSDSILMRLLSSAMDNAYEKVESPDGPIECLHQRSIFYQLSIIQIKGCYDLIQQETDSCIRQDNMLVDLIQLQDLLQARLEKMKTAIHEKDSELIERSKNEFKLRHALASKERQIRHLYASIEIERAKSKSFQDFILNSQANNRDEAKEREICQLRSSIDRQVMNIKQKLVETDADILNEYENWYFSEDKEAYTRLEQNLVTEQMSSDIDILEGPLKIGFQRMQSAEVCPLEEQVQWMIERETTSTVTKAYIRDLKKNVEVSSGLHMLELIQVMTRLRDELATLIIRNENIETRGQGHYNTPLRTSGSDYMEELAAEDLTAETNNHVAKLIRNHEYFIWRQQRKLLGCNKGIGQRCDESRITERGIRNLVDKLDSIIKFEDKKWTKTPACLDHDKRKKGTSCSYKKLLIEERNRIKEEKCASELQQLVAEDTQKILFKDLLENFYLELCDSESESFIRDEIYFTFYRETIKELTTTYDAALEEHQHYCLQKKLQKDICTIFMREMVNEFKTSMGCNVTEISGNKKQWIVSEQVVKYIRNEAFFAICQHQNLLDPGQSSLKEDIDIVLLREIVDASKIKKEAYEFQNFNICWPNIVRSMKEILNWCHRSENMIYIKNTGNSYMKSNEQTLFFPKCPELNIYLMPQANAENLGPVELVQFGTANPSSGYVTAIRLVSKNLQSSSMHQLSTSKELLKDPQCSWGIEIDDLESLHEKGKSLAKLKTIQSILGSSSDIVFSPLIRFQKLLMDFKTMAEQKLQINDIRLEKLKQKVDLIFQASTVVRKNNLLYRDAFARRCYNLQLAENEVDLLGDEVDALLGLLHKIYSLLDQYSPILSLCFDVSGILKQIDKKLNGTTAHAANQ